MNKTIILIASLAAAAVLSGCNGASSASSQAATQEAMAGVTTTSENYIAKPSNTPPVAYAGKNRKIKVGDNVDIVASLIPDKDGDKLVYIWAMTEKPMGSNADLSIKYSTKRMTSFQADKFGRYIVALLVRDENGGTGADTVTFSTILEAEDFSIGKNIDVNWKEKSNVNNQNAQAVIIVQGEHAAFVLNGDIIRYEGDFNGYEEDHATLRIWDDADEITVQVTASKLYEFSGIKTDLPIADLAGWHECYRTVYADMNAHPELMEQSCTGSKIMLACRETGSAILKVAAYAQRDEVFFNTGDSGNTVHTANDVDWYYSYSYSMGFAPVGEGVDRNSADIQDIGSPYRLSWHTHDWFTGGFRCGNITWINYSNDYEKIIYEAE